MAQIVCRIEKLHTIADVGRVAGHNDRAHPVPNADPDRARLNRLPVGSGDLVADVQAILAKLDGPVRKNGVIAVEMILTARADWFARDRLKVVMFERRCIEALRERYGERLIYAKTHLDEDAPHLHCVLIPTEVKPDGKIKLNARALFGGPTKMRELQDWAAEAIGSRLGLERGTPRIYDHEIQPRRHMSPRAYRAALDREVSEQRLEREAMEAERGALIADRVRLDNEISAFREKSRLLEAALAEIAGFKQRLIDAIKDVGRRFGSDTGVALANQVRELIRLTRDDFPEYKAYTCATPTPRQSQAPEHKVSGPSLG